MQTINDPDVLEEMKRSGALFILFGGAHCKVCHAVRPQLAAMLARHYPDMQGVYVDCEAAPGLCARHGVFSLPAVQAYIEGMKIAEAARVFGVRQLQQQLERPYTRWCVGMAG